LTGLKVAFLSDFHIKSISVREKKILEILEEEKPDLVLLSGDYISFKGSYEPVMSFFHQFKAPYGIYGVLGNTEYSNENGSCILCHNERSKTLKDKQNPVFLRNSLLPLKINGKILNIIGVDDPVEKKSDLKTSLKKVNFNYPSILLSHSPEIFEEASNYGIDLLLCGHTHGGQIFLTKYIRYILPLDPILEFIEGFFQKGRTLMYVSRGIGTSFLPFRFGVKPEITFFTFSISNNPPKTIFTGLSLSNLIQTFDIFNLTAAPQHRTAAQQYSKTAAQKILWDFESESDLKRLNWQCHKWFELSEENVTSGKYSLKVSLPPGEYPGIDFQEIRNDCSKFNYLKMDVFNPSEERITFHIRIDDNKSGWEYADRFDINFNLKQGMNHISIPTDSIRSNMYHRLLDLKRIKRMILFLMNNTKPRELYLDNIRLE
jgi:hypothetical protein